MDRNTYSESRQQLLVLAQEHGYHVSATQLARWHRAGILPRPHQQPMGKAHGTQSLYPVGTGAQLLLLCELHTHERRLAHLAWQIWWGGYPVDLKCIREILQQVALRLSERIRWFIAIKQQGYSSDQKSMEESEEEMEDFMAQFAFIDIDTKLLRRVRKRLGKDRFITFMHIIVDIASGTFQGYSAAFDRREVMTELRILARGLGLEEIFIKDDANITHYIEKIVVPLLQEVSPWLITLPWEQALKVATNFDLLQVRDALRMRQHWFEQAKQAEGTIPYQDVKMRDYPTWSTELQEFLFIPTAENQAMQLVLWLALSNIPFSSTPTN